MVLPDSHGVARAPWYSGAWPRSRRGFAYGGVTLYAAPSQVLLLPSRLITPRPFGRRNRQVLQPPLSNACRLALKGFGLVPVRSPLLGESRLISIPPGTEMVQFPGLALLRSGMTRTGFPHSEIPASSLACQLDGAYRRLLRPSSPPDAKASTVCPSLLDPNSGLLRPDDPEGPSGHHHPRHVVKDRDHSVSQRLVVVSIIAPLVALEHDVSPFVADTVRRPFAVPW